MSDYPSREVRIALLRAIHELTNARDLVRDDADLFAFTHVLTELLADTMLVYESFRVAQKETA